MGGMVPANHSVELYNKSRATATKLLKVTKYYTMYKRAFKIFLNQNLIYKKDVYEKSMELQKKPLPDNYIGRLNYEQEEIVAVLDFALNHETSMFNPEEDGLYCKALKVVINEENLHMHWEIIERCIFPKSSLTWMEYIFGPVFDLFKNPELNDFILEWNGGDREAIIKLFLRHSDAWNYFWMNYYRDVVENPTHYEQGTRKFPQLPKKLPRCLGQLSGCENRSHHFCNECIYHFNTDPEYAYTGGSDNQGHCNIQVPTTPETRQSIE